MRSPRPHACILRTIIPGFLLVMPLLTVATELRAAPVPAVGRAMEIVARMETVYGQVTGYQTETEVREYREGEDVATKRFRYAFRKPDHLRIDMESPDAGMTLIYPDQDGKVLVRPGGWAGFLKLRLAPDNMLFRSRAGQRINQTDLGLLIQNIRHSLTDRRHGEIRLADQGGRLLIEVLADDHFLAGVRTLYRFYIDTTRWLPTEEQELTPDGVLKRTVIFRNLQTNRGFPDDFFNTDGEGPGDGRSDR